MKTFRFHHTKYPNSEWIRFTVSFLALITIAHSTSQAAPSVEAYLGEPFGVARVTVDVFRGEPSVPLNDERFTVWQENHRTMYPVVKQEPAKRLLRRLLSIETPRKVSLYFLFQGKESFDASVFSPIEQAVRIHPVDDARGHQNLLDQWWNEYSGRWKRLCKDPQFPPMAENFLVASLSRRLNLDPHSSGRRLFGSKNDDLSGLSQLFASEAYQLKIDREMVMRAETDEPVLQPLPEGPAWPDLDINLAELEGVEIEPLAAHVPEECFYVRFDQFLNYLWFRDLTEKWNGDLQNMIVRRAVDRAADERTQQQLSLKYNAMAKILGPRVVKELAIVGLDPYTTHGAGVGVVMHAKNNFLLSQDMMRQRRRSLGTFADAEESTVSIAGVDVSLVATPGGEVRSYYVQQGDFHIVSTSRHLVERFIEAGQGVRPLAALPTFLQARQRLPIGTGDTVFVFTPEKFFENLCSPHYFIENLRRIRSAREPLLLELAGLAAITENAGDNVPLQAGILPTGFASRADGSVLEVVGDKLVDSRRGAPGYFLPIADMQVEQVSASEAAAYESFSEKFREQIGRMPSVAASVRRQTRDDNTVTMALEVVAQPSAGSKLHETMTSVGTPSPERLAPVPGNVIALEVVLESGLFSRSENQEVHLFGGLRDYYSPLSPQGGTLTPLLRSAELVRGYLGTWPRPEFLNNLFPDNQPPAGEPQLVHEMFGEQIWADQWEDFVLFSFKPAVVSDVRPHVRKVPAERPAHLWLDIEDLTGKKFAGTVNALGYMRSRETSAAGSRMMNSLANQFRIGRPECRDLAERLLDGKLICPLGGEYELLAPGRDLEMWVSSALPPQNRFRLAEVPEDFQLPFLDWFRGLNGEASFVEDILSVRLNLHMAADAVPE